MNTSIKKKKLASDKKIWTKTSADLSIEELRLLGMALDLAESPVSLYDKDKNPIYANAAARTYWPLMFDAVLQGQTIEEAVKLQIETLYPHLTQKEILRVKEEIFDNFHKKEPSLIYGSEGRVCRTIHHRISNIAFAGMGIDITELNRNKRKLNRATEAAEFRAAHDPLTSLPNRSHFKDIIEEMMLQNENESIWLLMCDIDKFKLVNDIYGHDIGDKVLVEFPDFIKSVVGEDTIISRLGGDEFAIIIQNTEDRILTPQMLKHKLAQKKFEVKVGSQNLEVKFSAGAAKFPVDASIYDELLKCADLTLLRAKSKSDCNIDFYDQQLGIEHRRDLSLFSEIETALSEMQIIPYFQPIIDRKTRKISSLEALVRWNHPTRGLLTPDQFQKTFRDRGLSLELSKYMLKMVTGWIINWKKAGNEVYPVHINVEASDLLNPSFLMDLMAYSTNNIISADYLGIELTENSILNVDNIALLTSLDAIRKLGIKILLDDFGTGFSSITHLDHLPITGLKLDKSYIQKIRHSERSQKIVTSIVNLSKELNLETIAEGIENEDELSALDQIGCTAYQGYFFSYPLSMSETERLLSYNEDTADLTQKLG